MYNTSNLKRSQGVVSGSRSGTCRVKGEPYLVWFGGKSFFAWVKGSERLAGRGPFHLTACRVYWDRLIRSTGLSIERDKRWVYGPAAHYSTNHQSATYMRERQNLSWYDPVDDDRELRVMTSIIWLAGTRSQILITCRGKRAYVPYTHFFSRVHGPGSFIR